MPMDKDEMEFLFEVGSLVPELIAILQERRPAVQGAVVVQLVARYLSRYPQDKQAQVMALLSAMCSQIANDLREGIDRLSDLVRMKTPVEPVVVMSDETLSAVENDPAAREFLADMTARIKNALVSLQEGKFSSIDEAMASVGGGIQPVEDEDIADLNDAMKKQMRRRVN